MDECITKANSSTVWEEIYGYVKRYICALAVYLMTIVLITLKISIYIAVGAPTPNHGEYVVIVLNSIDKKYLRK